MSVDRQMLSCAIAIASMASPSLLAQSSPGPVRVAAQRASCGMSGRWGGSLRVRLAGNQFKVFSIYTFEFGADASYSFAFGDESGVAASQNGEFQTSAASDAGSRRYPCLVTLTPSRNTMRRDASRQPGSAPKGLDDLLGGVPVTFRVRASNAGGILLMHVSVSDSDLLNDIGAFSLTQAP
jgi:hypothetical protein